MAALRRCVLALLAAAVVAPAPAQATGVPPAFEANRGQLPADARFGVRMPGHALLVTAAGARVSLPAGSLTLRPVAAGGPASVRGERRVAGVLNELGRERHARIPLFARVRQRAAWPGVDLLYRLTGAVLEYDVVVRAGADLGRVRIALDGARELRTDASGALLAEVGATTIRQAPPVAFQRGRRLAARFVLHGDRSVSFSVPERDPRRQLVIDPVLSLSGFAGGSFDEAAQDVDVDAAGNVYVTGWTTSRDMPTRNPLFGWDEWNAICGHDTCPDAFVAKYAPGGRSLIYATFLSGDRVDRGNGIAADAAGHAYVAGNTTSTDFPTRDAAQAEYRCGDPLGDAFVAKLAPDGAALRWSTYHGGCRGFLGESAQDVAVDAAGNAYVAGYTDSREFPTTAGAADRVCAPDAPNTFCGEAFAAKFSPGGALVFSTFFGGDGANESAQGVAVDSQGRVVIAGTSQFSGDFPTTPGAYDPTPDPRFTEAWTARLSASGSAVDWATTFGGEDWDDVAALALDPQGRAVVVGTTESHAFPTTAGALDRRCNDDDDPISCTNHPDGFVTKLEAGGGALAWSTYLGGTGYDDAFGVDVAANGDVFATGGASTERAFPLREAFQPVERGGAGCGSSAWCADAFLVRLTAGGGLVSGTLLGGESMDRGLAVAVDAEGDAWVAGQTYSYDFPATAGAVQPLPAGGDCSAFRDTGDFNPCSDGFLSELDPAAPPPAAVPPTPPPAGSSPPPASGGPGGTPAPGTGAGGAPPQMAARALTLRRRGTRLAGRLRADRGGRRCIARAPLALERRSGARWHVSARLRTGRDGGVRVRRPRRAGRYRLRAPALRLAGLTCRAARSQAVSLPPVAARISPDTKRASSDARKT